MKLNKKQKRTATIASMAALLAVVLGMGGQTFAKYIETNEVKDQTAVVAKWGVVIQNSIEGIDGATGKTVFSKENDAGTVESSSQNVVAPGTEGGVTIKITGVPQVAAKISFALTIDDVSLTGPSTYYPIVWTITEGAESKNFNGSTVADGKTVQSEMTDYLVAKEYEPNVSLERTVTISWAWSFDGDDDMDTLCGNAAANGNTTKDVDDNDWTLDNTIGLTVTTTVEQIQTFSA